MRNIDIWARGCHVALPSASDSRVTPAKGRVHVHAHVNAVGVTCGVRPRAAAEQPLRVWQLR